MSIVDWFLDLLVSKIMPVVLQKVSEGNVPEAFNKALDRWIAKHVTPEELMNELHDLGGYLKKLRDKL